jgi:hypothetical protein
LDITSDDIDLTEIDEDIVRFQQDELVQKALETGVDLREYSKNIESELRQVEIDSIEDCKATCLRHTYCSRFNRE